MNLLKHQDEDIDEITVEENIGRTHSYLRERRDTEVMPGAQGTISPMITGTTVSAIQATAPPTVITGSASGMQVTIPPLVNGNPATGTIPPNAMAGATTGMQATISPIVIANSASTMQATIPPMVTGNGGVESISTQDHIQQASTIQPALNNPPVQLTAATVMPKTVSSQSGQGVQVVAQPGTGAAVTSINANSQMNTTPLPQTPPQVQQGEQIQTNSIQTLPASNQIQTVSDVSLSSDENSSSETVVNSASAGKPQLTSDPIIKDHQKTQVQTQHDSGGTTTKSAHVDGVKSTPKETSSKGKQSTTHSSKEGTSDSGHDKNQHVKSNSSEKSSTNGTAKTKKDSKTEESESDGSPAKKKNEGSDGEKHNPILDSVRDFAKTVRGD
jgi:hypothetical protein